MPFLVLGVQLIDAESVAFSICKRFITQITLVKRLNNGKNFVPIIYVSAFFTQYCFSITKWTIHKFDLIDHLEVEYLTLINEFATNLF